MAEAEVPSFIAIGYWTVEVDKWHTGHSGEIRPMPFAMLFVVLAHLLALVIAESYMTSIELDSK